MSNNSFDPTEVPPWFSSLESLTTLYMENTQIRGQLPVSVFSPFQLQTVVLKNNRINGTLNIGSTYSSQLQLIDLQDNSIGEFTQQASYNVVVILVENPICTEGRGQNFCTVPRLSNTPSYSTPTQNCVPVLCSSGKVSSPTCQCAYPYIGTLVFRAPSFSNFGNISIFTSLHDGLMNSFLSRGLAVDSVALRNPSKDADNYLILTLEVFPSGLYYFDHAVDSVALRNPSKDADNYLILTLEIQAKMQISAIAFLLSNQIFKPPRAFGPFYFRGNSYPFFAVLNVGHKSSTGIVIGAAVGGTVLFLLLLLAGVYAFRQKRRAETAARQSNPFASWDPTTNSGGVPKLTGAKIFSFEQLQKCTNNFAEINSVGSGGYGKVYRGTLPNEQLVAIKRAVQGSMQGGLEFKTEIELLSRFITRMLSL